MPVSLPTAAAVRKAREQGAEVAKTPLLAVLGAGDYAVTTVSRAVTDARTRANERAEEVQTFVQMLPKGPDELRKAVADLREQAEESYGAFAERGEQAWGRIRRQPQVKQAITTIEAYTEQLDARVDTFVDEAHDAAEKALSTVTRQTRSTGEKVARTTQKVAAEAAEVVAEVAQKASDDVADASTKVAEAGAEVAADITEAGDEAAHTTRSVSRRAANRTAPRTANRKPTRRRPSSSSSD